MSQTFDLTQEPFAMLTLAKDQEPIKINLIKRKDRPTFEKLQEQIKNKELGEDFDTIDRLIVPQIDEADLERFNALLPELTLFQIGKLIEAFFSMNGMELQKAVEESKSKEAEQAK